MTLTARDTAASRIYPLKMTATITGGPWSLSFEGYPLPFLENRCILLPSEGDRLLQ